MGLLFTFRFVEFSSQLWWFPGFLESPQLRLKDLPSGEAPGAYRASFQQKMLLFCFRPMTKVNTRAVGSIFGGVFRSGFKAHEWRQHVSATVNMDAWVQQCSCFLLWRGGGESCGGAVLRGVPEQRLWVLWKALYSFLKCSQSPRPENKTRRLY